jgi:outer membrane protein TolC
MNTRTKALLLRPLVLGLACMAFAPVGALGQVSFGTAVDLALRNSAAVRIAEADQAKAKAALDEVKDAYIPSLTFGSGLAKGTGFPLGDPSVVRLVAQGLVFNDSQRDFIRASRDGLAATTLSVEDTRQQVILDTALSYAELDATENSLVALQEEESAAKDLVRITQERVQNGVDASVELKKAQLRAAQARLKRVDLEAQGDVLREHLEALTGIRGGAWRTAADTVPAFPPLAGDDESHQMAMDSNDAIKEVEKQASAKQHLAFAQHRVMWRPQIDLLLQYGYYSDFNNYSIYYQHPLPPNNIVAGVQITLPLFNVAQGARARQADADAAKAFRQVDLTKHQVSEDTVRLRRAVEQTDAAEDVARLQHELSQSQLEAIETQASSSTGAPGVAPVTPKDAQAARIDERSLLTNYLAARLEHVKAELSLLRATGQLEAWARTAFSRGDGVDAKSGSVATTPKP